MWKWDCRKLVQVKCYKAFLYFFFSFGLSYRIHQENVNFLLARSKRRTNEYDGLVTNVMEVACSGKSQLAVWWAYINYDSWTKWLLFDHLVISHETSRTENSTNALAIMQGLTVSRKSWNMWQVDSSACIAVLLRLVFKCSFFLSVWTSEVKESGDGFSSLLWVWTYKNERFSCTKVASEGSVCSSTNAKLFFLPESKCNVS